ncbi:At2g23090 like protein [Cokeromyces recurvatus]|uniref:At2g23090 like protein n=1 Tax=Cokeromyces recurvatus TaxID=90255 RepID=UPI00221F8E40|nr:At2g23090 like protein [Cokeromyces recurvatus]KAI7907616.1 At2g23090 like protein [Cokeromyces recurvatus]
MGNGQKAQMKRERNAKNSKKEPTSQLKANQAAKNIICKTCFQTFLCTSREKALTEHAENKHNKTMKECFPDFVAA